MNGMTKKIEIIKGDITKVSVDAIVNAANSSLLGGGGVDGAIHRAGGEAILEECKKIVAKRGGCNTGEAVITTAGSLLAKFVIHTVGPLWYGGKNNEVEKLANCYKNSLKLAVDNNCTSIAFPGISTGVYRFPKDKAANIAVKNVQEFVLVNDVIKKILFVCFDDEYFHIMKKELERNE